MLLIIDNFSKQMYKNFHLRSECNFALENKSNVIFTQKCVPVNLGILNYPFVAPYVRTMDVR